MPDFSAPPPAAAKGTPRKPLRLAGSATVEVVGDLLWERTERLRLFKLEMAPELAQAFNLGSASTTNRQQLSEFMALGGDFRTPSIPSVYYNCLRPSMEDPELARSGVHISAGSRTTVTLSAGRGH
jgi:hypothetical protein